MWSRGGWKRGVDDAWLRVYNRRQWGVSRISEQRQIMVRLMYLTFLVKKTTKKNNNNNRNNKNSPWSLWDGQLIFINCSLPNPGTLHLRKIIVIVVQKKLSFLFHAQVPLFKAPTAHHYSHKGWWQTLKFRIPLTTAQCSQGLKLSRPCVLPLATLAKDSLTGSVLPCS